MGTRTILNDTGLLDCLRMLAATGASGEVRFGPSTIDRVRLVEGRLGLDSAPANEDGSARTAAGSENAIADLLSQTLEKGVAEIEFTPMAPADAEKAASDPALPADAVLARVAEREAEWCRLREVIPTPGARVALRRGARISGPLQLEPDEWRVICAVGDTITVRALSAELGVGGLATHRLVAALVAKELIDVLPEVVETASDGKPADAPSELLVRGVKDVLQDVAEEMADIAEGRPPGGYTLSEGEDGSLPAEWEAYYGRLDGPPGEEDPRAASG